MAVGGRRAPRRPTLKPQPTKPSNPASCFSKDIPATRPARFLSCSVATLRVVRHSVLSTTPTAEKPALSDEERAERRRRLAERVFSPDGLDRDTLEHIEQLTGDES
jgi:hypothetical protein